MSGIATSFDCIKGQRRRDKGQRKGEGTRDNAIIGASLDDHGPIFNGGSAYIFVRSGNTWSQQKKLPCLYNALRLACYDLFA